LYYKHNLLVYEVATCFDPWELSSGVNVEQAGRY